MPPRVSSVRNFLAAKWISLAIGLVCGISLALGYGYWRSAMRLKEWRHQQESIAKSDLTAIKAIMRAIEPLDQAAVSTIESLKQPGELIEQTATERVSADQSATSSESKILWNQEAGGFHRLRYTVDLDPTKLPAKQLVLTRRYPLPRETPSAYLDWFMSCLLFTSCSLAVLWSARTGFRKEQLCKGIEGWEQRMSSDHQNSHTQVEDTLMDCGPRIARSLAGATESMRRRLLRTENSVQQSTHVMSAMPIGVLAFDSGLKLLFVNRAGMDLLGLSSTVQYGQPLIEVVRQPTVLELVQSVSIEMQSQEVDLELSDRKLTLRLRALPLTSSNAGESSSPQSVLLAITDETRLKQLENARRDFTANVSHELKTPLSAIKAYAETLLIGALEDESASRLFVERINEQANRLDILIRDLLHLTRLQSQPEKPPMDHLVLNDVLKTCVEEHATIGRSKNIAIDVSGVQPSIRVVSNLESLRTVVGNLLSNAVRYNREGGWVKVQTIIESESVRLLVEDNGIGIPPEDLDRIFERFYRVEKARSQDLGGTGLGLSIVKHLVQSMSGEIRVRSVLGQGSCFELKLPRGRE